MYIIGNREDEGIAYRLTEGWVSIDQAQYYTEEEKQFTVLPKGGYWCPLWSLDSIQFARFINNCKEIGLFDKRAIKKLAEMMNLNEHNIENIIDRATYRHEDVCMKILEVYEMEESKHKLD